MQWKSCGGAAIALAVSALTSGAFAAPVTLVCHGVGFTQNEAGPTLVELDEAQKTVTIRFSGYIPPLGSTVTSKYTIGPEQAKFTDTDITFQDSPAYWVLNRLTGDMKQFTQDGQMTTGAFLCRPGAKQF